jgi:hypothetical protein
MGGTYSLIFGVGLLGVAYGLREGVRTEPWDWLTSPAEKVAKQTGNKDVMINYAQQLPVLAQVEYPAAIGNGNYYSQRAALLNGVNTNDPKKQHEAAQKLVLSNLRTGSGSYGPSHPPYQEHNR